MIGMTGLDWFGIFMLILNTMFAIAYKKDKDWLGRFVYYTNLIAAILGFVLMVISVKMATMG